MTAEVRTWSPDLEFSRVPLDVRHAVCPYGAGRFTSEPGVTLCANCFQPPNRFLPPGIAGGLGPCSCRRADDPEGTRFVQGRWIVSCFRCERTWRGEYRLGDHGRWERTRPSIVTPHSPGIRAPNWFFDDTLTISALTNRSVSFSSSSGMILTASVTVPGLDPLEGRIEPFELSFCPEGRHDSIQTIVPDETTRERLRSTIEQAIRDRLEQAARGEESLIRVRGHVNLMTRVFDLLS